jgi:DNA-binding beta-propeller fold protein YncE
VGEIVGTKLKNFLGLGLIVVSLLSLNGCGSSGSGANVITVTLGSSVGNVIILGQSTTITATVNGANNSDVVWPTADQPCQYTTTTVSTSGTSTTKGPFQCPSDGTLGTLTNIQTTGPGTATYTAPSKLPDQTTYPGLQIIFTAESAQNNSKKNTLTITLDSGIGVTLNQTTATVPTKESQGFNVVLTNDLQTKGVTWLVTQNLPTSTQTYPQLASCSPGCGTITAISGTNSATYTAPDTVPTSTTVTSTPAVVTLVVTSAADTTRFALGSITIIQGGPITFSGISPNFAPQGAAFWDIYLDAPNMSSSSIVAIDGTALNSTLGQIKVTFPIPTSSNTTPASTGARIRLDAIQLAQPGTHTVSITDPGETVSLPSPAPPQSAYQYTVVQVRPTSTATVPDDIVQGAHTQNTSVIVDGGYFGPSGNLVKLFVGLPATNTTTIGQDINVPSGPRQLNAKITTAQINASSPGLYPLYLASTVNSVPTPTNPSATNIAFFPDYSSVSPALGSKIPAGNNPNAIDIDPTLGIVAVAATGSNAVKFYSIVAPSFNPMGTLVSGTLTPMVCPLSPQSSCDVSVNFPTSLSINRHLHTVAVVSYLDQTVQVFPLPVPNANSTAPAGLFSTPLSLKSFFTTAQISPAPIPYSIGVDPDTNLALVAFSNTSSTTDSNIGFVVNLNTGNNPLPFGCLDPTVKTGPCIYSQVTLNSGAYPQIAVAPHGHIAFASPGGSGTVTGVDLTKTSTNATISSAVLTAGIVTITTTADNGLIPGNAGTVLISGVPKGANGANFNGMFSVAVTGTTTFTYALNSTVNDSAKGGTVFYGKPDAIYAVSSTAQGIAINPITRVAALADANATGNNGPQIDLLNSLDQVVTSITFHADCTFYSLNCSGSPELLSTSSVAWQPYSNALVSYNPQQQQVSVSDPHSLQRYALVKGLGPGGAQLNVNNGTTGKITIWGGVAVDPVTNQAFVLESGATPGQGVTSTPGQIEVIALGPTQTTATKPTQISEVLVPGGGNGTGFIGGIPGTVYPQGALACTVKPPAAPNSCDLAGVKLFGSGFASGAQVRLDGTDITTVTGGTVNYVATSGGREIDVTIPGAFLKSPHHYALDVVSSGAQSNVSDFTVIQAVDLSQLCPGTSGQPASQPSSVAIIDQIAKGPFSPKALVTINPTSQNTPGTSCNSLAIVDINPANTTFGQVLGNPIGVGTTPMGVAVSQHRGIAVVTNNGSADVSVIDLTANPPAQFSTGSPVSTGTNPAGVAVNEATDGALVANTGSNTVTMINFGTLFPPSGSTATPTITKISIGGIQQPLAVAIDPDRGTNFQGIGVVGALSLSNAATPTGSLAVVDIGLATPSLSTTISSGLVNAVPTGIVFDPIAATGTENSGLFYANSSGTNTISSFNPDNGQSSAIDVGINPISLTINPQTGAILTSNSASNTVSVVDTNFTTLRTVQTIGLPGSPQFAVAIDQFTNLAVIVDQLNQRLLLYPMPN